jgi:hypothetical protein
VNWEQIQAQVDERFGCECAETEIRYRIYRNGVKHFHKQCLRCGEYGSSVAKAAVPQRTQMLCVAVDEELRDGWQKQRQEYAAEIRRQGTLEKNTEWFQKYDAYLKSEAWQKRARKVLERDGNLCQACLKRPATQAHHLTYEHVFNEPLFDLVSVCPVCHQFITQLDRKRRGTTDLVPR